MTKIEDLELTIRRLQPEAGDWLVIEVDGPLKRELTEEVRRRLGDFVRDTKIRGIVVGDGTKLHLTAAAPDLLVALEDCWGEAHLYQLGERSAEDALAAIMDIAQAGVLAARGEDALTEGRA